jgi:hypothetical protein
MAFFRLTEAKDRFGTVINIDGQLAGDCVQVIEDCCSHALSSGTPVSLFLRDVSVVDEAGRDLLSRLADQGVRLLASGIYTSHLVENLQRSGRARRSPPASERRDHT